MNKGLWAKKPTYPVSTASSKKSMQYALDVFSSKELVEHMLLGGFSTLQNNKGAVHADTTSRQAFRAKQIDMYDIKSLEMLMQTCKTLRCDRNNLFTDWCRFLSPGAQHCLHAMDLDILALMPVYEQQKNAIVFKTRQEITHQHGDEADGGILQDNHDSDDDTSAMSVQTKINLSLVQHAATKSKIGLLLEGMEVYACVGTYAGKAMHNLAVIIKSELTKWRHQVIVQTNAEGYEMPWNLRMIFQNMQDVRMCQRMLEVVAVRVGYADALSETRDFMGLVNECMIMLHLLNSMESCMKNTSQDYSMFDRMAGSTSPFSVFSVHTRYIHPPEMMDMVAQMMNRYTQDKIVQYEGIRCKAYAAHC